MRTPHAARSLRARPLAGVAAAPRFRPNRPQTQDAKKEEAARLPFPLPRHAILAANNAPDPKSGARASEHTLPRKASLRPWRRTATVSALTAETRRKRLSLLSSSARRRASTLEAAAEAGRGRSRPRLITDTGRSDSAGKHAHYRRPSVNVLSPGPITDFVHSRKEKNATIGADAYDASALPLTRNADAGGLSGSRTENTHASADRRSIRDERMPPAPGPGARPRAVRSLRPGRARGPECPHPARNPAAEERG